MGSASAGNIQHIAEEERRPVAGQEGRRGVAGQEGQRGVAG